jgi:hypothetical protein
MENNILFDSGIYFNESIIKEIPIKQLTEGLKKIDVTVEYLKDSRIKIRNEIYKRLKEIENRKDQ